MSPILIEFYFLFIILLLMVAYAGTDGTLRVFQYLELVFKLIVVNIRKFFFGIKLKRQLDIDRKYFENRLKKIKENAKRNIDEN